MNATAIEYIRGYLATSHVATIATVSPAHEPWIFSVYYVFVSERLLFVSKPDTKHSQHIGDGANIAFSVTDSNQRPPASAHGIQGLGFARPATYREYPMFVRYYAKMFPKYGDHMENAESLRASVANVKSARPYVLIPHMLKLTDKRFSMDPITIELDRQS
jgi:uncharacterized protein YhbP (UPF0306 family)